MSEILSRCVILNRRNSHSRLEVEKVTLLDLCSAVLLAGHFVTEEQQAVRKNGDSCSCRVKMSFSLCKI